MTIVKYKSMRENVNEVLKNYFSNPKFQAEKEHFIASICVETSCKRSIVSDLIKDYIVSEQLYEDDSGIIKNIIFKNLDKKED